MYEDIYDSVLFPFLQKSLKGSAKSIFCLLWYHINKRYGKTATRVKKIEFVCNGNICRSVFAERYASRLFAKMGYSIKSSSSGLWAKEGSGSPEDAIRAASIFNVDLQDHISRKTDVQYLKNADLIFCMHINQYQQLCRNFSAYKKKIFLLKAYTKPVCFDINIDDPYGKSIQQYFLCFEEISRSVEIVAGKLSL